MPYLVTTKQLERVAGGPPLRPAPILARRAVATLDEARDWIADQHSTLGPFPPRAVADLSERGGKVGPLTDGTVIEVQRVGWAEVRALGGLSPQQSFTQEEVLEAYNARQAAAA